MIDEISICPTDTLIDDYFPILEDHILYLIVATDIRRLERSSQPTSLVDMGCLQIFSSRVRDSVTSVDSVTTHFWLVCTTWTQIVNSIHWRHRITHARREKLEASMSTKHVGWDDLST